MNIYEAMKARTAEKPFLMRTPWREDYGSYILYGTRILPTGTVDGCILVGRLNSERRDPAPRWQPKKEDLLAEDWEVTD